MIWVDNQTFPRAMYIYNFTPAKFLYLKGSTPGSDLSIGFHYLFITEVCKQKSPAGTGLLCFGGQVPKLLVKVYMPNVEKSLLDPPGCGAGLGSAGLGAGLGGCWGARATGAGATGATGAGLAAGCCWT